MTENFLRFVANMQSKINKGVYINANIHGKLVLCIANLQKRPADKVKAQTKTTIFSLIKVRAKNVTKLLSS